MADRFHVQDQSASLVLDGPGKPQFVGIRAEAVESCRGQGQKTPARRPAATGDAGAVSIRVVSGVLCRPDRQGTERSEGQVMMAVTSGLPGVRIEACRGELVAADLVMMLPCEDGELMAACSGGMYLQLASPGCSPGIHRASGKLRRLAGWLVTGGCDRERQHHCRPRPAPARATRRASVTVR